MSRRAFIEGVADAAPLQLAVAPFGLIFGALATSAGLALHETMGMTLVVLAGASQLAALQQMSDGAPALVAIFAGAIVNLRMAMYSAALAPLWRGAPMRARLAAPFVLFDMTFVQSARRYHERPDWAIGDRVAYFFGLGLTCLAVWSAATLAGALVGARTPPEFGLAVAPPLVFLSVVGPFLRSAPHLAAAAAAAGVSLLSAGLPYSLGLMAGAAAGIATGLVAETARRRA